MLMKVRRLPDGSSMRKDTEELTEQEYDVLLSHFNLILAELF